MLKFAEHLSAPQVFRHNLQLRTDLRDALGCYLSFLAEEMKALYRTSVEISFIDVLKKPKTQYEGVLIHLKDIDRTEDLVIYLNAKLARKLIARKLTTVLVDDSHKEQVSSTETGIISFIVAEFLWKLKAKASVPWPNLELIAVSKTVGELSSVPLDFSLTAFDEIFFISALLPESYFLSVKSSAIPIAKYLKRVGHLRDDLALSIKTLHMDLSTISKLSFGDLILFDHSDLKFQQALSGNISGRWHNLMIYGYLSQNNYGYQLVFKSAEPFGEHKMEMVEVTNSNFLEKNSEDRLRITESLRVLLSIELARVPITLKDLAKLQEGEIIDLKRNITDPLEMVLDGKVIGFCQPVEIDGRLGVRVLEFNQP